jgi:glycosyltransferase involved in cell wall biosynthesis
VKGISKGLALFLVPSSLSKGGVSNYYSTIRNSILIPYEYFYRGVKVQDSKISRFTFLFSAPFDYIKFYRKLKTGRYPVVIINTSFGRTGLLRDWIFIKIVKKCKIKYVVFFRGVDEKVLELVSRKYLRKFQESFLKADKLMVLSDSLKVQLRDLGYKGEIITETTVFDPDLLSDVTPEQIAAKQKSPLTNLLFLSRIEKSKGIYELVQAFLLLAKKYPDIKLRICGKGRETVNIMKLAKAHTSIQIVGHVENMAKIKELLSGQLFILPSYHEGMPNSILEAMSFGLVVVTTPVGGIPDIFRDGVNGCLLKSTDAESISTAVEHYISDPEDRLKTAILNHNYAKEKFSKEVVGARLSSIISDLTEN